jgi:hypothetical protein
MQLTHAEEAELRAALVGAFPGIAGVMQLTMALQAVDIDVAWAGGLFTSTEVAIDSVIVQENARGKIENVIGAARRANSGNANLAELESKWLKTSAAGEEGRLEAMILDALKYAPAEDWGARLNNSYRWVCRVEREVDARSLGTGFLVADDLVLTNYHVLHGTVAPGTPDPVKVQLRFDAVGAASGRVAKVAAGNWLVATSEPSRDEWGLSSGAEPTSPQLDFALVRLAEPVGKDLNQGSARGHVRIEETGTAGKALNPVVVLQHPLGASLQICLGAFDAPNADGTRLRHTATTQKGSSGSPCLSMDLKAVGLHNGGLGGRNTAIPLPLVASAINKNGTVLPMSTP